MVRRRLTLKRIDPWSVLKFGFVANLSLLAIGMLGFAVVWFFIERLRLIDKVCEIAIEMGFAACGVNGGNLLRALFLLGLLGVVIQTGLMVFLAFLFNLIADLVGGLTFSFVDETPGAAARGDVPASSGRTTGSVAESRSSEPRSSVPGERKGPPPPLGREDRPRTGPGTPASTSSSASPGSSGSSGSTGNARPQDRTAGPNRDAGSGERMWNDTQQAPRDPGPR